MKPGEPQQGVHSGAASGDGIIAGILAEARQDRGCRQERADQAETRVLRRQRRRMTPARWLLLLTPALVLLTIGNVLLAQRVPDLFSVEDEEARARLHIYLAASALAAYEVEHGAIPASLQEVGLDLPELTYEVEGTGYRLIARAGLRQIFFIQGDDLTAFAPADGIHEALTAERDQ